MNSILIWQAKKCDIDLYRIGKLLGQKRSDLRSRTYLSGNALTLLPIDGCRERDIRRQAKLVSSSSAVPIHYPPNTAAVDRDVVISIPIIIRRLRDVGRDTELPCEQAQVA